MMKLFKNVFYLAMVVVASLFLFTGCSFFENSNNGDADNSANSNQSNGSDNVIYDKTPPKEQVVTKKLSDYFYSETKVQYEPLQLWGGALGSTNLSDKLTFTLPSDFFSAIKDNKDEQLEVKVKFDLYCTKDWTLNIDLEYGSYSHPILKRGEFALAAKEWKTFEDTATITAGCVTKGIIDFCAEVPYAVVAATNWYIRNVAMEVKFKL